MKSLKRQEGWLYIDNRNSQGVPDSTMMSLGLPLQSGHGLFETATYTCGHCHATVIIEPKRTRERGYCAPCDRRICDPCNLIRAQTMACASMERTIEQVQEAAEKQSTIILPIELRK